MKLISLWLDAISPDKISKEKTPFLDSLSRKSNLGVHLPVFGFTSLGAAFYTGGSPVETNQFCLFWRQKDFLNQFLSYCPNFLVNGLFNLKRVLLGKTFLAKIPDKRLLTNFSLAQNYYYNHPRSLSGKTLLEYLREKKIQYLDYNWPYLVRNGRLSYEILVKQNDEDHVSRFVKLAKASEYQVLFLHLYDLDKIGHQFGPDSKEYLSCLRKVDSLVKQIFDSLIGPGDKFLIWSDHGMLKVKKLINLEKILPPQRGYVYFLDSTMARFWFSNQGTKTKVLRTLKSLSDGNLLSQEEKRHFKINFGHSKYGEEIFLCHPGVLILPNFFQKRPIKGMHGYDGRLKSERGFFMTNIQTGKKSLGTQGIFSLIYNNLNQLR
jgi:predicted AlkP superfamily pyrophosphatase or phosphodiesterase